MKIGSDIPGLFGVLRWADRTCWRVAGVISLAVAAGAAIAIAIAIAIGSTVVGAANLAGVPIISLLTLARLRGGAPQGLNHIVRGQVSANLLRPLLLSLLLFGAYWTGVAVGAPESVALNSVTAAVAFGVAHAWLKRRLPPREMKSRAWLSSAIPLALTDAMRAIQGELAVLLVGLFATPAAVGLFRIASVTALTAAAVNGVVGHVALPTFARLHAEQDRRKLQKTVTALPGPSSAESCQYSSATAQQQKPRAPDRHDRGPALSSQQ